MGDRIEILAPAGSYEALEAAVCAGADAVYAGGKLFGARACAENFSNEELLKAIDYVHLHGRKLFLTVNTLFKEEELERLLEYLRPFYCQGLDGVIVQDTGALAYIRESFPGLPIHASTQMNVTNVRFAKYLEGEGISRVIPARELSLAEIKEIRENTGLEIECFVHGSLCYSYSGQCLLSSMIGGRSGNRGRCAQPCRLSYRGQGKEAELMSLKDLCALDVLPELLEAGITSLKIEGRMKSSLYAAAAARLYRKYADQYLAYGREGFLVSKEDKNELLSAYQRRGYTRGYYFQHNGRDMLSLKLPQKERKEVLEADRVQEEISGSFSLCVGEPARLTVWLGDTKVWAEGEEVQEAEHLPLSEERVKRQLLKSGDTPFVFGSLKTEMKGRAFFPIQSLNKLRRETLQSLENELLKKYRRPYPRKTASRGSLRERAAAKEGESFKFSVQAETLAQIRAAVASKIPSRIYAEDTLYSAKEDNRELLELFCEGRKAGIEMYFSMARIFRREARERYGKILNGLMEASDGMLARNPESLLFLKERGFKKPIAADAGIYSWNRRAEDFWLSMGFAETTAPLELHFKELLARGVKESELVIYGYLPVMVSAGCVRKNTKGCSEKSGSFVLWDRLNSPFMVRAVCEYCYNTVYNKTPLSLLDQRDKLELLRPKRLRLQFTKEDEAASGFLIREAKRVLVEGGRPPALDEFTRGNFKRGVK